MKTDVYAVLISHLQGHSFMHLDESIAQDVSLYFFEQY